MASKDALGKELSSFFKAAVTALEDVSEQVMQSGKAGKATIDVQVLKRQRDKALAKLGELVLTHVATGGSPPPAGETVVAEIATIDAQLKQAQAEADKLFTIGDSFGAPKADRAAADRTQPPTDHKSDPSSAAAAPPKTPS